MTALEAGARVRVSRPMRPAFVGEVARVEGSTVYVVPEGKVKPKPFPVMAVRALERRPPAPPPAPARRGSTAPTPLRAQPKEDKPGRFKLYRAFVSLLPCCSCGSPAPSEPHHVSTRPLEKGLAQKVDDLQCVPLCSSCHREHWHGTPAALPGMTREESEALLVGAIPLTLRAWARREGAALHRDDARRYPPVDPFRDARRRARRTAREVARG